MPNIYAHEDSGCYYKLKKNVVGDDNIIEWCPMSQGNVLLTEDMFGEIEYDLVGDETITHEGKKITINEFRVILLKLLSN